MDYSIKDLDFLWSKTVNLRKRSSGEPLMVKSIVSTRRGKYWKICNEMHNCFSTSYCFLQRWKLEYHCQNIKAKSALLHARIPPVIRGALFIPPSFWLLQSLQLNDPVTGVAHIIYYIAPKQARHSGDPAPKGDERVPWYWDSLKKVQMCKAFVIQ